MPKQELDPESAVALLRENAAEIESLTRGMPATDLAMPPAPGAWSATEVLAHVRACADVWGGTISRISGESDPAFAGVNPRTWMKQTDYLEWEFEPAQRAFAAQRRELLELLAGLAPDDWERSATVLAWGQANRRTLRSYASQLGRHERTHVKQIARSLRV